MNHNNSCEEIIAVKHLKKYIDYEYYKFPANLSKKL